jgi:hypothetical protein
MQRGNKKSSLKERGGNSGSRMAIEMARNKSKHGLIRPCFFLWFLKIKKSILF